MRVYYCVKICYVITQIPEYQNNFTCTSSSFYSSAYTCNKLYDHDTISEWVTLQGQGKDAWVDIQLHSTISINKIEVLQPQNGLFRQLRIVFSNGDSRTMDLGSEMFQWNAVDFEPPINTTSLNVSALQHYNPEEIGNWFYRIKEISINGNRDGAGN